MKQKKTAIELHVRQQKRIILIVVACFIFLLGAGWVFLKPKQSNVPQVVLLKEIWILLENSAREWQDDAYLTSVSFYVTREMMDSSAFKVGAEFHSSHVPSDEMLFVGVTNSGKVVNRSNDMMPGKAIEPQPDELKVSVGSSAEKPIYQGEWSIDSQDALNIFARDQEVNLCFGSSKASIELSLNKIYTDYPAWELIIINCPEKGSINYYYLNAKTGELFDPFIP